MTKATDARIKRSQERTRLRQAKLALELEQARRDFIQEQRALRAERAEALVLLRLLCERYGRIDWSDDEPLAQIIERHLFGPLEVQLAQVVQHLDTLKRQLKQRQPDQTASPASQPAQVSSPLSTHTRVPGGPARATGSRPEPGSRHLQAVPETVHRLLIVPAALRNQSGFRANCTCGWLSPQVTGSVEAGALWDQHLGSPDVRTRQAR